MLPNTQKFTAVKLANQAQTANNQVNCWIGEYGECIHAISVSYRLMRGSGWYHLLPQPTPHEPYLISEKYCTSHYEECTLLMTFYTLISSRDCEQQFSRVLRNVSVTPYHWLYFVTVNSVFLRLLSLFLCIAEIWLQEAMTDFALTVLRQKKITQSNNNPHKNRFVTPLLIDTIE